MSKDYDYSYDQDNYYCYPDSGILKNKLNIHEAAAFSEAEREITSFKMAVLKTKPLPGSFDLKHLKAIHKYLFEDIYEWAGELRWVNIAKGNQFTRFDYVEQQADTLFSELKDELHLTETDKDEIPHRLSYYLSEINVLHPFREGNGRTQRLFIEFLAANAGYDVDFSNVTAKEMIEASAEAFACNYEKMNKIFDRIIFPLQEMP